MLDDIFSIGTWDWGVSQQLEDVLASHTSEKFTTGKLEKNLTPRKMMVGRLFSF